MFPLTSPSIGLLRLTLIGDIKLSITVLEVLRSGLQHSALSCETWGTAAGTRRRKSVLLREDYLGQRIARRVLGQSVICVDDPGSSILRIDSHFEQIEQVAGPGNTSRSVGADYADVTVLCVKLAPSSAVCER